MTRLAMLAVPCLTLPCLTIHISFVYFAAHIYIKNTVHPLEFAAT